MRLYRALTALTLLSVTAAKADDQPLSAPETVVTATRIPTPVEEIPAGVTVIDRATIEAHGYNTLSEALADVPGLHVSPSGGAGGQASVFIRGTNSDHVLVLRDGMPLTDASDPTAAFNFGTDTLPDVERIEIIRGPMAALYGSGAIGGVINLISRRGTEPGIHWSGDLAGGYPALIRGSVTASGIEGPVDFAVTAESQSQRGYDSIPQRESVYTGMPQGFRDRILTLNLGYTPVEGTRLSLFLRADTTYFGFDTLGFPTYDDSNSTGQTASLLGRVGGTTHLFDGKLETSVFVGQLQDDRRYLETLAPADPNQTFSDARYHSYRTDAQWNNTLHLDDLISVPGLSASAMTFGYEYTGDTAKVRANDVYGGYPYAQGASASMTANAVYAGFQTTVLKRLVMTGQIRQDWIDSNEPTTWRLGGVYDFKEIATHLKLAYGTGFRAPSLFDRYGVDSYGYVGNPNLKPEQSEGWEAGFTTDIPAAGRTDFVTIGATYFDQRVRNLIAGVYVPVDTEINLGSAHVHGVESEITVRPAHWLDVHAAYTLLNTTSVGQPASEGSQLLRRPQNEASFDVTVRPLPALRIVTMVVYTGSAHDYLYDNSGNGIGYGVGQHGLIANIGASYTVTPRAEVYLNGTNIFDSRFEPVNGYQTPGPTVLAGIRVQL
jgi:vitamin B12 transporter